MPVFVDTMAYAGERPWHGLGNDVGSDQPTPIMMQESGTDFEVAKAPVYLATGERVPGLYGMVCDDGFILEGVGVGGRYTPFQNRQLFAMGDSLTETGEARWHTMGSLRGRTVVWGLMQVAGQVEVRRRNGKTDVHAPFLLASQGHGGNQSVELTLTDIRVVCWNTLSAATQKARKLGTRWKARHTRSVGDRIQEAAEFLGLVRQEHAALGATFQRLADTPFSVEDMRTLACQLLTDLDDAEKARKTVQDAEGRQRALWSRKGRVLMDAFATGAGNLGADRYDAFNAVSEVVDHQLWARDVDGSRELTSQGLASAWMGTGAALKQRALDLLVAA